LLTVPASARFILDPAARLRGAYELRRRKVWRISKRPCRTVGSYDPAAMLPGRVADAFRFFCAWVYAVADRGPGRKVLLVDEVWKFRDPTRIPDELALCIQTGRKRGLELVFCTQRPNRLNGVVLNEVSEAACFRLQDQTALDKVSPWGLSADEVARRPMLEFLAVNGDSGAQLRGWLN
jgi:DNA helicase HerA-like ATPase